MADIARTTEALPMKKEDDDFPALGGDGGGKKKKGKKEKKEKIGLHDFLAADSAPATAGGGGSWADQVDDAPAQNDGFGSGNFDGGYGGGRDGGYGGGGRGGYDDLPRGPGPEEQPQQEVPERGPFKSYVGNLPYEVTRDDLGELFEKEGCKVMDVRLVMDRETQRPKGFGYVEFEDRESLVEALKLNGMPVGGRNLRVDVATAQQNENRGGFGSSKFGGGGGDRDWGSARSYRDDDRGGFGDRGGYGDRGGGDRGGYGDRGGSRGGFGGGGSGDRGGFESRGGGGFADRGGSRGGFGAPAERPRLNLTKRTAPAESSDPSLSGSTKASPFGDAKPVAVKEKEVPLKVNTSAPAEPVRKAKSSPFGDAKPVAVKEKEDLKVSRVAGAPDDEQPKTSPKEHQPRSKVGVWGNSSREDKHDKPISPTEEKPAEKPAEKPEKSEKPKAAPAPAAKKDKQKGPKNAFDALADEEEEEEEN